jgi:hypothetical protein
MYDKELKPWQVFLAAEWEEWVERQCDGLQKERRV